MKRLALSLLAVATVAGMASPAAQAQNWLNLPVFQHWNMNSLTSNEQSRINAGRSNGSLTADEANRLQNRLNDINSLKNMLAQDGISPSDQQTINKQLDQLSQDVYKESNDRQMLGSNPYGWSNNYKPTSSNWQYGHWDNGKWISKNNWNQYNNWRTKNWHNNWNNNKRSDGQAGSGMTVQETMRNIQQKAKLEQQRNQMSADGRLSRRERQQLEERQRRINQQERRDKRD